MAPCDQPATSSNSASSVFGMSGMIQSGLPNATSAPPPPCTSTSSVSTVMIVVTIAGFVTIILATVLLVYILRKLGWFYQTAPEAARAARLRALREAANVAKGLDPAVIRSFPVHTFRDEFVSREVTTETTGLASLRSISREFSRTLSSSSRQLNRELSLPRCPAPRDGSSNRGGSAKERACETGSERGEFVVTIEGGGNLNFLLSGDDPLKLSLNGDDFASEAIAVTKTVPSLAPLPPLPTHPTLTWANVRECAVCLGEYAAGERIKVVPACAHGFHADCIDLWLAAKTTCPICRTDLKPKAPREGAGTPDGSDGSVTDRTGSAASAAAAAAADAGVETALVAAGRRRARDAA
ncbi:hypothetical protein CLOM_g11434 [Closterium sp. NIES-68]|nr:hypothetical protein CLOM_g11434 [Closterium sp. NIES-68]